MAANNLTNKLKVFAEATTNKLDDTAFAGDIQRQDGYQPNQIISSKITNTILRQTSVVTTALVEALKELSEKNLTNAMTFGSDTILADAKTAIKEALVNVKVAKAVLADNVVGGALVEETNIARKFKAGWQISQEFKEKMVFKGTWEGTYINNDIVYYGTAGAHKGYYVVHGLTKESVNESTGVITPAQTLTIKSTDVPTSAGIKNNLQRLTFETTIGTNTSLSKTDTIASNSTTNQLATAKGVYDYAQAKVTKHTTAGIKILTRGTTNGVLSDLDKVTSLSSSSTDSQIPSAKAVFDIVDTKVTKIANYSLSKNDFTDTLKSKLDGIDSGAQVNPYSKTQLDNKFAAKVDKVSGKGLSTNDLTNTLLAKLNSAAQTDKANTFAEVQTFSKLPVLSNDEPTTNNPMSKSKADNAYFKRDIASSTQSNTVTITSTASTYTSLSKKNMYVVVLTVGYGGSNNLLSSNSFSTTFHGAAFDTPSGYNDGEVILFGVDSAGITITARLVSSASGCMVRDLRFTGGSHSYTHFKFAIHRIS